MENITPNTAPDKRSPASMEVVDAGDVESLSYVFAVFSQGVTRGPTAEAVKNRAIEISPGASAERGIERPTANARKKKIGKIIPKMSTGGFT